MKVGSVLVVKPKDIRDSRFDTSYMRDDFELKVIEITEKHLLTDNDVYGIFTLEPDALGISYKSFFTVKGE